MLNAIFCVNCRAVVIVAVQNGLPRLDVMVGSSVTQSTNSRVSSSVDPDVSSQSTTTVELSATASTISSVDYGCDEQSCHDLGSCFCEETT